MITTITTITTVTTVTTIAGMAIGAVISVVAVLTLLAFLTTRELAGASNSNVSLRLARITSTGILPLVMAFAVIVIVKIAEVL